MEQIEKEHLLEQLMIDYGNELVRFAFSYVKDIEVAKDIVQNVFFKCYKGLETFRYEAKLKTWLYRITINECKDYLKSWHYRMVQVKTILHETTKSILPSIEAEVIEKYEQSELKDIIFTLPKMYREVIYLYYYDSMSTEEIAQILDVSVNTVKTRLRRAKQRLAVLLEEVQLHGR